MLFQVCEEYYVCLAEASASPEERLQCQAERQVCGPLCPSLHLKFLTYDETLLIWFHSKRLSSRTKPFNFLIAGRELVALKSFNDLSSRITAFCRWYVINCRSTTFFVCHPSTSIYFTKTRNWMNWQLCFAFLGKVWLELAILQNLHRLR